SKRLYLLTNHTANNVLIYNKDGRLCGSWGNNYPGAHGLTITNENGTEFLFIADYERHQVIKTTLSGQEVMVFDYPKETGRYASPEEYKPTETAIAPNGDIYVTDGYGLQYVIQYNHSGEYIRHWGGRGERDDQFDCVHGVALDNRDTSNPILLITSRNQNAWKRFTLDGTYISAIHLPGSFVCRPVVHHENIYGAVFRSGTNQNNASGYITVLDKRNTVVSTPGGTAPQYKNGNLQEQKQDGNAFIHPHDVCVDDEENLYVPQWNANGSYPVKLERIR
ncbi:MAG TPA: hypothetical protein VG890_17080, partial [Puia sp.]|nr:hypothetical protein [Puia sp.]